MDGQKKKLEEMRKLRVEEERKEREDLEKRLRREAKKKLQTDLYYKKIVRDFQLIHSNNFSNRNKKCKHTRLRKKWSFFMQHCKKRHKDLRMKEKKLLQTQPNRQLDQMKKPSQ